jgi:hypothetical protein
MPLVLTRHVTAWHPVEYRELLERFFHDQTRLIVTDSTCHNVRSTLLNVLLLLVPDVTPTERASVRHASACGMN